jgi:serine/threonine protein kinase
MRAKVKIIDFGFATKLTPDKNNLAQTALGSPINMDPLILNVMAKKGKDLKQLGYDDKADIWSLGTICYELLIGKTVFNAETMNDLVQKVESGNYHVPTSLSREMVSFLNSMLQYDGSKRLNAEELSKHAFLTKDVRNFTKINTRQVQRKIDNKGLNINIKRNQTIWSIFNEEDEQKLIGINDGNNAPMKPIPEYPQDNTAHKRHNTDKNVHKMIIINKNYGKSNSNNYPFVGRPTSIYGQNMSPNQNNNYMPQYPNFNPLNNMSPFPQNNAFNSGFNPMMLYPTFDPSPNTFNRNFNRNVIQINSQGYTSNYMGSGYQEKIYVYPNSMNRNNEVVDLCSIQ